jgi:hypothetical protein
MKAPTGTLVNQNNNATGDFGVLYAARGTLTWSDNGSHLHPSTKIVHFFL